MLRLRSSTGTPSQVFERTLDTLSSNVMIADNDRRIVYMNRAVTDFLRNAEDKIRQDVPAFRVDGLVGRCIDDFHADPDHQRRMLAALDGKLKTRLKLGGVLFDLVVNPIFDSEHRRLGSFVEWFDASMRLKTEKYSATVELMRSNQAYLEFDPDGVVRDCNDNFEQLLGYAAEEIRGQHYSVLIPEANRNGPELSGLWEALRAGQAQVGEFERRKKNGEAIWIRASYSPIPGENGEISGVVKFGLDITQEVTDRDRRSDALRQIDTDLSGITEAMSSATSQASTAAGAADQTSSSVQSVAAGIEEMSVSVRGINDQVSEANAIATRAVKEAEETTAIVSSLSDAALEIEKVVELISDIAEQTNLLALNATIEAARAGDAGKGFAVVAAEVKGLAGQTAKATDEISARIANVQKSTESAVSAIQGITETIAKVNGISAAISTAMDEQSNVTSEIAGVMQQASMGVSEFTGSIKQIADATRQVDDAVIKVKQASAALA